MDNNQANAISGINKLISESLSLCIEDIFDDRNDNMVFEAYEFIQCLRTLESCENDATGAIIENVLAASMDRLHSLLETNIAFNQIPNIKSNVGESHITDNHPLPDVYVFSTLYDKGYLKDSYMQKHVASQLQSIRATASTLMGKSREGWSLRPNTSQGVLGDWIDWQSIFSWNEKLKGDALTEFPSDAELVSTIIIKNDDLHKSIVDGTFEDMSVNTLMCHVFATIAALIIKQELKDTVKNMKIITDLISFQRKFGVNGFFIAGCMVVNLAYAKCIWPSYEQSELSLRKEILQNAERFHQWIQQERNLSILLPTKDIYPRELSSLLQKIATMFGFNIQDEATYFGIAVPISMNQVCGECDMERHCEKILEESEKIGLGLTEIDMFESLMAENDATTTDSSQSDRLDSLAEGLQVESERSYGGNMFASMAAFHVHSTIMEHQNQLLNNALRHNHDALKTNLAENLIMMEWLNPMLTSGSGLNVGEVKLLADDMIQMEYQNKKYIGVVEADSMESLYEYANANRGDLESGIWVIVNKA